MAHRDFQLVFAGDGEAGGGARLLRRVGRFGWVVGWVVSECGERCESTAAFVCLQERSESESRRATPRAATDLRQVLPERLFVFCVGLHPQLGAGLLGVGQLRQGAADRHAGGVGVDLIWVGLGYEVDG